MYFTMLWFVFQETGITEVQMEEESSKFRFALTGKSWEILRQHFPDILSKVYAC